MSSTRIACILNKDNKRSYIIYVSIPSEMEAIGIYAGMDCCCSAGSIAISDEVPLSGQVIGREDRFFVAYGTWLAAWPAGRSSLPSSSLPYPVASSGGRSASSA